MRFLLTPLLLVALLGLSGCLGLYGGEGSGYMGGSQGYEESGHHGGFEHDD